MAGADPIAHLLEAGPPFVVSSVAWVRSVLPQAAGAVLAVVGLIVAAVGSRSQVKRVVGGGAAGLLGVSIAGQLAPILPSVPPASLRIGLGVALAAVGAWAPGTPVFLGCGLFCGWLASTFVSPADRLVAFAPAFLVGGLLGAFFTPGLFALSTGLGGGIAFALGLAAAIGRHGGWLWAHPFALVGLGLAVGAAGVATQLSLPDESARRKRAADRSDLREIRRAEKARDARFREYAKRGRR